MTPPAVIRTSAALLVACLTLAGCSAAPPMQAQPARLPPRIYIFRILAQKAPPITEGRIFRMADAVPMEKIQTVDQDTSMAYRLNPPQTPLTLYFGEVRSRDDDSVIGAMIAVKVGEQWRALQLNDPGMADFGWEYVAGGPKKDEVWGVLDSQDPDAAEDLALVHSTDGGATWALASLHKPAFYATFNDFSMARDGHGRVSVFLEADYSSTVKTGYYHYRTADGGKTWSKPEFEPDGVIPAEQVPEEEQPKSSRGAARASAGTTGGTTLVVPALDLKASGSASRQ